MSDSNNRLPETVADLLAQRRSMRTQSLIDYVDRCHVELWSDPAYRRFFSAIHPAETVEGSFIIDEIKAAEMIREHAAAASIPMAGTARLAAVLFALHRVCRRYQMSRNERRGMAGVETINLADAAE